MVSVEADLVRQKLQWCDEWVLQIHFCYCVQRLAAHRDILVEAIAITPLASGFGFDRPVAQSNGDRPPQKSPR
jgi:hypothetical protein